MRRCWRWGGKMSSPRCDGESGDSNGREDREDLIAAIPSSISEGEKKSLTIFLNPQPPPLLFCPPLPPSPTSPLHPSLLYTTPPLFHSLLSRLCPPLLTPPLSLQEAVVNQVRLPQSLWSSLCPRSLAEAGVVRRRRAADGGSAVNHCH